MSEHTDKVLKEMGQSSGFSEHVERTLGWHLEHKRLGFADPIADIYEELLNEKAQLSEENTTFNAENVEPNTTQDVQGVGSVGDYISRQAAIDVAWFLNPDDRNAIKDTLTKLPSADVVEVVRCKDCKYREPVNGELLCGAWEAKAVDPDDFCSDGERETDAP